MTNNTSLKQSLWKFDPDTSSHRAVALLMEIAQNDSEQPVHRHRKGQLVMALHGWVTCEVPKAMWLVPPQCAVWIPGGLPHSNHVTNNAQICFLFVEPGVAPMPEECCTLSITPLVRELILYLANQDQAYPSEGMTSRLVSVLLEQLATMPIEQLHLPISGHPKVRKIASTLSANPADRTTLAEWADQLAMSARSLARLIKQETGLTFGHWRQQLHLIVALRQLASGAAVQQVANNLGYDSVTAFITMFKKALGQPPGRYFAALH